MPVPTDDISLSLVDDERRLRGLLQLSRVGSLPHEPATGPTDPNIVAPTMIIEGSTYAYELTTPDGDSVLATAIEPRELFEPDRPSFPRGRLRINNRAGVLLIRVTTANGESWSGSIHVASAKLRYDEEYRWMLRDITSELAEAAVLRFAPTQGLYVPIDRGEPATLYQRFAFLQAILQSSDYRASLQQLLAHPYVVWQGGAQNRLTSRGVRSTHQAVRALTNGGPSHVLRSPIRALRTVPREIPEQRLIPTTDNVPNQFIKAILEDWRALVQSVHDALYREANPRVMSAVVVRGISESKQVIDTLDAVLATPLFRRTSRLKRMPMANQALLRRPGYRELVRIHQQTQLASTLTWDGADLVFGAGQRDVSTLYEYWVFLNVARIVAGLCGQQFDYASLYRLSDTGLQLRLRRRTTQVVRGSITISGKTLYVAFWFNRTFRRAAGESWTRNMRPDMSLSIGHSPNAPTLDRAWIHFDAKYRVEHLLDLLGDDGDEDTLPEGEEPETRARRDDLLKMHAYRDAIRRSSGAYVIYPGDGQNADDEIFLEYHELLPGLGAFALRPTESGPAAGESAIRRFIGDSLRHFADPLSQDHRARYWTRTIVGEEPVPSSQSPTRGNTVEGLWFLQRPPADELVLLASFNAGLRWDPAMHLLFFRTDSFSTIPALVLRSSWVVLVAPDDSVVLLELDENGAVEQPPAEVELGRGAWLGVRADRRDGVPFWLTGSCVDSVLHGSPHLFTNWEQLGRASLSAANPPVPRPS